MPTSCPGPDLTALGNGSVRARHVVVLFALVYFLALTVAYWLSRHADSQYRAIWQVCVWQLTEFAFFSLITACVPDLRRLFIEIIGEGRPAPASDVLIAVAVMLAWGLGASRILFQYSFVLFNTDAAYRLFELGKKVAPGPMYMLLGSLSATVLAPICEEIIFRGYLLNLWLARHRLWFSVWASSVFFGLWHFKSAPMATGMGFFLALIYLKHRSLVLCMVLHALYNTLVNRLLLGQFFLEKDRATVNDLSSWSTESVLAIAFFPLAWLFWKRFRPQSESNR